MNDLSHVRRRVVVLWSLLGLTFCAITGLILELGLRINQRVKEQYREFAVFEAAARHPCVVKPNLHFVLNIGREKVQISTNSTGMPWHNIPLEKASGIYRIAFVGDSFTFGEWANRMENSFVGVVDSQLSAKGVEVLNFGTPSDGPAEERIRIEKTVLPYDPDLVVLMFYNGNDMSDMLLGMDRIDCSSGEFKSEVIAQRLPSVSHPTFRERAVAWLQRRSALFLALRIVKGKLFSDPRFVEPTRSDMLFSQFEVSQNVLSEGFWSRNQYPPVAEEASSLVLHELEAIQELTQKQDVRFMVISIPFRQQVYALNERGDDYDINLPQRRVEQFAKERGIPYYDLLHPLRSYVRKCPEPLYVQNDNHFNTAGHRAAGLLIARAVAATAGVALENKPAAVCPDL